LPDGSTERDVLLSVERQTGKTPDALQGPPLPADAEHVWQWFLELHAGRGSNGFGPNPLSWSDLAAWASLTMRTVRPSEVDAIMMLDRLWMAQKASEAEVKPTPTPTPKKR
jgi:hypothetical protein